MGKNTQDAPVLAFAGHTDVVPPGDVNEWNTDPFKPTIKDNILYGRGAADMKGALAAMIIAFERFISEFPDHAGQLLLLVTSDEEGPATDGMIRIVDYLQEQQQAVHYCIVGEPSSQEKFGDNIKIGRRGSLHGELTIIGKQGHIAYPQLAENPIHHSLAALKAITDEKWDDGNQHFQATSLQIYDIQSGVGASNVIPPTLTAKLNFRFNSLQTQQTLQNRTEGILRKHGLNYRMHWQLSSEPFYTGQGKLANYCVDSIQKHCGIQTQMNTAGGTSDGRFIHKLGCEIVELGVVNKTIHQINECCATDDLIQLSAIYYTLIKQLLVDQETIPTTCEKKAVSDSTA